MTKEEIQALISESTKPLIDRVTAVEAENTTLKTTNARLTEAQALSGAKAFVIERLAKITMPAVTRQRLTESLPNLATLKDGVLDVEAFGKTIDEAAKAEMTYLASVNPGGVRGVGPTAPVTETVKTEDLVAGFVSLGMSEAAAKLAVQGRAA